MLGNNFFLVSLKVQHAIRACLVIVTQRYNTGAKLVKLLFFFYWQQDADLSLLADTDTHGHTKTRTSQGVGARAYKSANETIFTATNETIF